MIKIGKVIKFYFLLIDDDGQQIEKFIKLCKIYQNPGTGDQLIYFKTARELKEFEQICKIDANKIDAILIDFNLDLKNLPDELKAHAIALAGDDDTIKEMKKYNKTHLSGLATFLIYWTFRRGTDLINPFMYFYTAYNIDYLTDSFDRKVVFKFVESVIEDLQVGKPSLDETIIKAIKHCRKEYLSKLSISEKFLFLEKLSCLYQELVDFSPNMQHQFKEIYPKIKKLFCEDSSSTNYSYLIPDIISIPDREGENWISYEENLKPYFEGIIQDVISSFENQSEIIANLYDIISKENMNLTHPMSNSFTFTDEDKNFLLITFKTYETKLKHYTYQQIKTITNYLNIHKIEDIKHSLQKMKELHFRFLFLKLLSESFNTNNLCCIEYNKEEYKKIELFGDGYYIINKILIPLKEQSVSANSNINKIFIDFRKDYSPSMIKGETWCNVFIKIYFIPQNKSQRPVFYPNKGHFVLATSALSGYGNLFMHWSNKEFDFKKMSWQYSNNDKGFYYKLKLVLRVAAGRIE